MSRIDELIAKLAPRGVELKTLGEVGVFIRGNGLQKSDLTDTGAPAIHYGQIHTHYGVWARATKSFTDPALASKLRRAKPGDLIIVTTSEDDAAVAKATAWIGDSEVAVSGDAYIYRHSLEPRYAAYFFQSEQFQRQKTSHISGTKVRRISGASLAKIRIPVPPLEVQREIVRILDKFTQLEAELEAELEARRVQHKLYTNELFANEGSTPFARFGELCRSIATGKLDVNAKVEGGAYPFFTCDAMPYAIDTYAFDTEAILLSGNGSRVGHVNYYQGKFNAYQRTYVTSEFSSRIEVGYLLHYLQGYFREYVTLKSRKGSVPYITLPMLKDFRVPVPSLEEQHRIAAILDKFDALVNDLSVGLPAELAARRKQYEHYRDRLLTFEEVSA